jgi:hypothetical protein
MHIKQPMTPFWLVIWAALLALGWLLPNHYMPWTTFHMDAWVSAVFLLASACVLVRVNHSFPWHGIAVLVSALALFSMLQFAAGLVAWSGTAWVSVAYLLGFVLLLLVGAQWESGCPYQLADGLFLAIGIAALVSVGLQLHQWLGLDLLGVWAIGNASGRPSANLGQPNELGTLLIWGLLAVAWAIVRWRISVWTAIFLFAYLLLGLALTRSRTAWIAIAMLVGASWIWCRMVSDRRWPWLASGLAIYFVFCFPAIDWFGQAVLFDSSTGDLVRGKGELRPVLWALFMDAALQQPLFGYGWNQVSLAQLTVAADHPALRMVVAHSHNLFLDLMLWCGIPVGLFVSVYIVRWLWQSLCAVRCAEDALLVLFLVVVFNHAMLEIPLSHAYFLFPVGLVMGMLNVRFKYPPVLIVGRWSFCVLWLVSAGLLTIIVRDYLRIETSYLALRYEWAHVKTDAPRVPPNLLLLNQLGEYIRYARFEPTREMRVDELHWMEKVVTTYPNSGVIYKYANALAQNQKPVEAQLWLKRMCKLVPESECAVVKAVWAEKSQNNPDIAAVNWTDIESVGDGMR